MTATITLNEEMPVCGTCNSEAPVSYKATDEGGGHWLVEFTDPNGWRRIENDWLCSVCWVGFLNFIKNKRTETP